MRISPTRLVALTVLVVVLVLILVQFGPTVVGGLLL